MNCVIVDDEELAHHVIEEYISRVPFLNIVNNFYDIPELMQYLHNNPVDLIFLDINLPNISGIEFLKSFNKVPNVIITTAYDNCAVQSYELDVIDYLLKPFSFERFLKAAHKCYSLTKNTKLLQEKPSVLKESFIFVRSNNEDVKLNLNDIIRINAMKDYIIIYTTQRKLIVHQTMKSIMEKMNFENFIRVHNSHIVSLNHLQSVGKNSIIVANERIPVSEKYKATLNEIIDRFR